MSNELIVWFDDCDLVDKPRVGGKNASLGEMVGAGLPVPPGLAVTTDAYETLRSNSDLATNVRARLAEVDHGDAVGLRSTSEQIRSAIEAVAIDPFVEEAVREAYGELSRRCNQENVPVAVRSSCTAEDLVDASFAGQQDTFLWVTGTENVLNAMRRCWSSVFTDRAISYRHEIGYDHEVIAMSVGIQQMVDPTAAGVAFTLNPTDGDRSQIAIEASFGLGEAVVSGEVTPDNFLVDKVLLEIHHRTISPKHVELVRLEDESGVVWRDVEPERQGQPSVSDAELLGVARMAKAVEQHFGSPQDIEWAIDRHLPEGHNVVLLQSRPETVWSRRPRRIVSKPKSDFMDGIVSTLLSPVHTRGKGAVSTESGDGRREARD
ncbi:MAG: PEP/pyruvate-binding domain-containing protein [Acidimicrobiia bacterium]|nr:MAG: PEP/pyruvate-binding domain-containing protein [Acidimicrobiia bacterium]